jgi:hypothetical protein
MGLSRTKNLEDHKVPMKRYALNASGKGTKTEESETPAAGDAATLRNARDPGKPSRSTFEPPDRTTDRNPPRAGRPPPKPQRDAADSEGRKPPSSKGGEYGDESRGSLRSGGQKGTPAQARKLAGAMRGGARQQP